MELRIIKPSLKYTAGQWLYVQIPDISKYQWHPVSTIIVPLYLYPFSISIDTKFTITSAPEDPYISIHIRQAGDWTCSLGELLGVGPTVVATMTLTAMTGVEKDVNSDTTRGQFIELDPGITSINLPHIRIDGPYGAPAEDVFNCEVAVLIGAGIG